MTISRKPTTAQVIYNQIKSRAYRAGRYLKGFVDAFNGEPTKIYGLDGQEVKLSNLPSPDHSFFVRHLMIHRPTDPSIQLMQDVYILEGDEADRRNNIVKSEVEQYIAEHKDLGADEVNELVNAIYANYYEAQDWLRNLSYYRLETKLNEEFQHIQSNPPDTQKNQSWINEIEESKNELAKVLELQAQIFKEKEDKKPLREQISVIRKQERILHDELNPLYALEKELHHLQHQANKSLQDESKLQLETKKCEELYNLYHSQLQTLEDLKRQRVALEKITHPIDDKLKSYAVQTTDLSAKIKNLSIELDFNQKLENVRQHHETKKLDKLHDNEAKVKSALRRYIVEQTQWKWVHDVINNKQDPLFTAFSHYKNAATIDAPDHLTHLVKLIVEDPRSRLLKETSKSEIDHVVRTYVREWVAWEKANPKKPFCAQFVCPLTIFKLKQMESDLNNPEERERKSSKAREMGLASSPKVSPRGIVSPRSHILFSPTPSPRNSVSNLRRTTSSHSGSPDDKLAVQPSLSPQSRSGNQKYLFTEYNKKLLPMPTKSELRTKNPLRLLTAGIAWLSEGVLRLTSSRYIIVKLGTGLCLFIPLTGINVGCQMATDIISWPLKTGKNILFFCCKKMNKSCQKQKNILPVQSPIEHLELHQDSLEQKMTTLQIQGALPLRRFQSAEVPINEIEVIEKPTTHTLTIQTDLPVSSPPTLSPTNGDPQRKNRFIKHRGHHNPSTMSAYFDGSLFHQVKANVNVETDGAVIQIIASEPEAEVVNIAATP